LRCGKEWSLHIKVVAESFGFRSQIYRKVFLIVQLAYWLDKQNETERYKTAKRVTTVTVPLLRVIDV